MNWITTRTVAPKAQAGGKFQCVKSIRELTWKHRCHGSGEDAHVVLVGNSKWTNSLNAINLHESSPEDLACDGRRVGNFRPAQSPLLAARNRRPQEPRGREAATGIGAGVVLWLAQLLSR